jgi:molybdopterin-containing oxidoreductase family membrane subunit
MWLERFVIVIQSLHHDFLPSSWAMYYPTRWDIAVFVGTLGFFALGMLLFLRFMPMISIFELRELLPEAHVEISK